MQTKAYVEADETETTKAEQNKGKAFGRHSLLKTHFAKPNMTGEHPMLEIRQLLLQQTGRDTKDFSEQSEDDTSQQVDINGRIIPTCTVSASIELVKQSFTGDDPNDQKEQIQFTLRRKARIRQLEQRLILRFDEPIRIDIFSLLHTSGRDIWKAQFDGRTRSTDVVLPDAVHANLTFSISIRSAVLSVLSARYDSENMNESISLEASWERLPRCPEVSQLLDVSTPSTQRQLFGKQLGMSLSMAWTDTSTSSNPEQSLENFQFSAPEAAESQDDLAPRYRITFLVHGSYIKRYIQNDLTCPLCQNGKHFTNFNSLQLHLVVGHRRFYFQTEDDQSAHRLFTVSKIVHMSLREALPPAPQTAPDNQRSDQLGSFPAEVNDNEPVQVRRGRGRPRKKVRIENQPKRPRDVPDLPTRTPESHRVPRVKDSQGNEVNFYRTGSKRPLRPGEQVVDSDEEIDDEWLRHRQSEHLKKLRYKDRGTSRNLTQGEIEFMADFNGYIDFEERLGSSGDKLKRDAVIRFSRRSRHKFAIVDWRRQFEAMLGRLQMHGIIDQETATYCMASTEPEDHGLAAQAVNDAESSHAARQRASTSADVMQSDAEGEDEVEEAHIVVSSDSESSVSDSIAANVEKQVVDSDSDADVHAISDDDDTGKSEADVSITSSNQSQTMAGASKARSEESTRNHHSTNGSTPAALSRSQLSNGVSRNADRSSRTIPAIKFPVSYHHNKEENEQKSMRDVCVCGERVAGLKDVVFCEVEDCERDRFHMKCVGVKDSKARWRCPDCRSS